MQLNRPDSSYGHAGDDRYDNAIAERLGGHEVPYLTFGWNFPDALADGVPAELNRSPTLLTPPSCAAYAD